QSSKMPTLLSFLNKKALLTGTRSRFFHVQVDVTPNKNSLKFSSPELTEKLQASGVTSMEFDNIAGASKSRLARRILSLPSIKSVYFGADFVTVEKTVGI